MLIRADSAGCTHAFLDWVVSQRLSYSVGFTLPDDFEQVLTRIPKRAWTPAYDADGKVRDGTWVAEVTGLLNPTTMAAWPNGMRVIARKERPHPGAQLRITDIDGMQVTAFATNTGRAGNWPTSSCGTAAASAPKTGSEQPRTPDSQPPAARVHPKPDLVRHRRAGLRADRLAADTRLHRRLRRQPPGPPMGTQTPTATAVLDRRQNRPHRPPHRRAPRPRRRLDRPPADRDHSPPPARRPRLNTTTHPAPTTKDPPGRNRRPPRRHSANRTRKSGVGTGTVTPNRKNQTQRATPTPAQPNSPSDERSGLVVLPLRSESYLFQHGDSQRGFGAIRWHHVGPCVQCECLYP